MMNWYRNLPNKYKSALHTAWIAALGSFLPAVLGWFSDVQEWAGSTGSDFPSVTPLGKAAASAFVGLISGCIALLFRTITPAPQYPQGPDAQAPKNDGQSTIVVVVCVLAIIVLAMTIFGLGPISTGR